MLLYYTRVCECMTVYVGVCWLVCVLECSWEYFMCVYCMSINVCIYSNVVFVCICAQCRHFANLLGTVLLKLVLVILEIFQYLNIYSILVLVILEIFQYLNIYSILILVILEIFQYLNIYSILGLVMLEIFQYLNVYSISVSAFLIYLFCFCIFLYFCLFLYIFVPVVFCSYIFK